MTRTEFTREVAERVLIRCRRHCCVCGKFCGTKIELHHIDGHCDNSEENVLPVCFDCHAEISHYNEAHPRGRKYQPEELRKLREATFRKFATEVQIPAPSANASAYGQGFHHGASLSEKRLDSQLVWNFISRYGDFAIEVLVMFQDSDKCSMMSETLLDDRVITGANVSQSKGHHRAWDVGIDLGLWFADPDKELLVLTNRGRFFREMVRNTPELQSRYKALQAFWRKSGHGKGREKPGARLADKEIAPGWLGWLQIEKYKLVKINGRHELFVLTSVEPDEIEMQSVESPTKIVFSPGNLLSLEYDEETGLLILKVPDIAVRVI